MLLPALLRLLLFVQNVAEEAAQALRRVLLLLAGAQRFESIAQVPGSKQKTRIRSCSLNHKWNAFVLSGGGKVRELSQQATATSQLEQHFEVNRSIAVDHAIAGKLAHGRDAQQNILRPKTVRRYTKSAAESLDKRI